MQRTMLYDIGTSSTKLLIPFFEVSAASRYYELVVMYTNMINPELGVSAGSRY
jgi:hypothetical protein